MDTALAVVQKTISQDLNSATHYWLSIHLQGETPALVPVYGIWSQHFNSFYFYTHPQTYVTERLAQLPLATLYHQSKAGELIVAVEGVVEAIEDAAQRVSFDKAFSAKYVNTTTNQGLSVLATLPQAAIYSLRGSRLQQINTPQKRLEYEFDGLEKAESVIDWLKPYLAKASEAAQRLILSFQETLQLPVTYPEEATAKPYPTFSGSNTSGEDYNPPPPPTDPGNPGTPPTQPFPPCRVFSWEKHRFPDCPIMVQAYVPAATTGATKGYGVVTVSPGWLMEFPYLYEDLMRQIAYKGYIALFIGTARSVVDQDHRGMAKNFLETLNEALTNSPISSMVNRDKIGWWAHSMGTRVNVIAAGLLKNYPAYPRPKFIIAAGFTNSPDCGVESDAFQYTRDIPANIPYTILEADGDQIAAPWESVKLYRDMPQVENRQIIRVNSFGYAGLLTDHFTPASQILFFHQANAFSWYGYWKWTVGALEYHLGDVPDSYEWIYGTKRFFGGTCQIKKAQPGLEPEYAIEHEVAEQSW